MPEIVKEINTPYNLDFELNEEGRDFFVGDIHGMYDEFIEELVRVDFHPDIDRVFSVGDLIDRGPKSPESLNLLTHTWFHAVRGNHEELMLGSHGWHVHQMNGGSWTNAFDSDDLYFLKRLILKTMPFTMTVNTNRGKVGVVHAESAKIWKHNSLLTKELNTWARTLIKYPSKRYTVEGVDLVVVGHTPTTKVVRFTNHVYIDTGACFKEGYLTLLSVEELFVGEQYE